MPISICDLDAVEIFSDELTNIQILKKIADKQDEEDPFHALNIGDIFRKHETWLKKMPRVTPYFGNLEKILVYRFSL